MNRKEVRVVSDFGREWERFDQGNLDKDELEQLFDNYFKIFPWEKLPEGAVGFDLGCGSGRWAKLVAPRVGQLHLIDPSDAIEIARKNLAGFSNCVFHRASVDEIPLEDESCDFGYSLGVLHHISDTQAGLKNCVSKLKKGAPFLLYLYYRFDNKPLWYRCIWKASDYLRKIISIMPPFLKNLICDIIALFVYFPLARFAKFAERVGFSVSNLPLAQYRHTSFYTMRTDALDRFGTRLEKRFSRAEIEEMMKQCGLDDISFSDTAFWTAVGYKKN